MFAFVLKLFRFRRQRTESLSHSIRDYQALVRRHLYEKQEDRSLALAIAIGSPTLKGFFTYGDTQVAVLRANGLADGMAVYDLGCGCGRTAQALRRAGWQGSYIGVDVVPEPLEELADKCPGYATKLNYARSQ